MTTPQGLTFDAPSDAWTVATETQRIDAGAAFLLVRPFEGDDFVTNIAVTSETTTQRRPLTELADAQLDKLRAGTGGVRPGPRESFTTGASSGLTQLVALEVTTPGGVVEVVQTQVLLDSPLGDDAGQLLLLLSLTTPRQRQADVVEDFQAFVRGIDVVELTS